MCQYKNVGCSVCSTVSCSIWHAADQELQDQGRSSLYGAEMFKKHAERCPRPACLGCSRNTWLPCLSTLLQLMTITAASVRHTCSRDALLASPVLSPE